eukprot:UN27049
MVPGGPRGNTPIFLKPSATNYAPSTSASVDPNNHSPNLVPRGDSVSFYDPRYYYNKPSPHQPPLTNNSHQPSVHTHTSNAIININNNNNSTSTMYQANKSVQYQSSINIKPPNGMHKRNHLKVLVPINITDTPRTSRSQPSPPSSHQLYFYHRKARKR